MAKKKAKPKPKKATAAKKTGAGGGGRPRTGGGKTPAGGRGAGVDNGAKKAGAPDGAGGPDFKRIATGGPMPPGRGLLESEMNKIGRLLADKDFESIEEVQAYINDLLADGALPDIEPSTPAERAQEIIYEAWDADGEERVDLALEALDIHPDCVDAYLILAGEETFPLVALEMYREAVEAGERTLGAERFEEDAGHFWGLTKTRPYMRARLDLAMTLWDLGKQVEAVEHAKELLRLNPNDNQGIRYILSSWLVMMDRDEELVELLDSFEDEPTACWAYAKALVAFRHEGDSKTSRGLLEAAIKCNTHVPEYLLGEKEIPDEPPDTVGFGDETEAVDFFFQFAIPWCLTRGATGWLHDVACGGEGAI